MENMDICVLTKTKKGNEKVGDEQIMSLKLN